LRVVRALGPRYAQTVLLGYPPFLKDVADAGIAEGFAWHDHAIRLVLAGEVISEDWRDLMAARLGFADPARDTASLYGTADGGVLGNETPISIVVRRFLARDPEAARAVFQPALWSRREWCSGSLACQVWCSSTRSSASSRSTRGRWCSPARAVSRSSAT